MLYMRSIVVFATVFFCSRRVHDQVAEVAKTCPGKKDNRNSTTIHSLVYDKHDLI